MNTKPIVKYTLRRVHGTQVYTAGTLYRGSEFVCHTLEDQERAVKIYGVTAIRTGEYQVIINMSTRFKKRMPLLLNVPNFTGVRIHAGVTSKDTEGCVLTAESLVGGTAINSRKAYAKLFALLEADLKTSNVWLKIE